MVDEPSARERAATWKRRQASRRARIYAAQQRDVAALDRTQAAVSREEAARMRAEAARVRDDGARTRDDGARVRDSAAVLRDQAALARDRATRTRAESLRVRLATASAGRPGEWDAVLELDREASEQSHEAATRDREAAELDRRAAERDREAAEFDRRAAASDREAAEKDREAADKDRAAADADRAAADADCRASEEEALVAEGWLETGDRLVSLGRLAATLTHEVAGPLQVLQGSLDVLELDPYTHASPDVRASVADARHALTQVRAILADIRGQMRGEDGAPTRVELSKAAEDAVRLTRGAVAGYGELSVDLDPGVAVLGVASRLCQLIVNLLMNAAESREPLDLPVTVSLRVRESEGRAVIEVEDDGRGIPEELLPHIFDPFFTTREDSGGTGIGLALVRRIVDEHHGTVDVTTKVGEGTTFTVALPLHAG
jgi:signal transduction histidine kinase